MLWMLLTSPHHPLPQNHNRCSQTLEISTTNHGRSSPASCPLHLPPPPATSAHHRPPPHSLSTTTALPPPPDIEDFSNKGMSLRSPSFPSNPSQHFHSSPDLKERIDAYFKGDEQALPSIAEAIFRCRLLRKHDETDDEVIDELPMRRLTDIVDKEVESDFSDAYPTEDLPDLYDATSYVKRKMISDEFFNMNDTKWDEMVREGVQHKLLNDTRVCEGILEDMLN